MLLSYRTTFNSGRFHLVCKKNAQVLCRSHAAVSVINAGIPLLGCLIAHPMLCAKIHPIEIARIPMQSTCIARP